MVTFMVPAATALLSELLNCGHDINNAPDAAEPSARYTTSEIVVVSGGTARATLKASSNETSK
jgi:hypothetical protein